MKTLTTHTNRFNQSLRNEWKGISMFSTICNPAAQLELGKVDYISTKLEVDTDLG